MHFFQKPTATLVLLCTLLIAGIQSAAQSVRGQVTDAASGESMNGATVIIKETGSREFVQLDGKYQFKNLKPGTYQVEVSFSNYKTMTQTVTVKANETVTLDIRLESEVKELSGVVVSGTADKDGSQKVRNLERNAEPVVNMLSAKTIQLLPDITVANTLQRVSGVTIEKSGSGEARYPIIRGMEKRYINTLVNGIKIPSPDNRNRFIPLDLFPSELLERLEVSKSLTPSMEGDAIGGTINLVMKDAPARLIAQANAAMGYNNTFQDQDYLRFSKTTMSRYSPREKYGPGYTATPADFPVTHLVYSKLTTPVNTTLGFTLGDRLGESKKIGFIVSGSYQNIFRGTKSNFFLPNAQPGLDNIPLFSDLQYRLYSVQSERMGINAKLDYQINAKNKIAVVNSFVKMNDYQTRIIYDTVALNSLVNNSQRSQWQYQSINNTNLQGQHQVAPHSKIDWSLVYSVASSHLPDQTQFVHQYAIVSTSLTADKLQSMNRIWGHNTDKDYSAYGNFTQSLKLLKKDFELKAGGMYRRKDRDNFYINYGLSPQLGAVYTNIYQAAFIFNPAADGNPALNGLNYTFHENVAAGYLQGKWQLSSRLEALGGLRVEDTRQHYETVLSKDVDAKSGKIWYTDLLPSLQFKYKLNKAMTLRLAYYKALARPGFSELIPDGADGEFFKEVGDPVHLQHTLADNLDLRYEWYSGTSNQLLLGVFYKNIQDPIEISAVKPLNVNSLYLQPVNIGNATNYGFEAVFTHYFGPFGISGNYTYTKSSITNDSMIYSSRNSSGQIVSQRVSETRPLQGQSNHIANLSLIYKNPKIGFDIQTALVYTGERINFISPYLGLHYWQAPTTQLDLSFEKRIVKHFTFYGKINNITNAPFELSLHQSYNNYLKSSGSRALALQDDPDHKIIIQKDYYKTSFLFGLRYKL